MSPCTGATQESLYTRLLVVKYCGLVGHKEAEARYQRIETTQALNSAQQGREHQSLLQSCSYEGYNMPEDWWDKWIRDEWASNTTRGYT